MLKRYGLNRNLTIMCSTIFLNVFFANTWTPLLALYYRALGANDWQIGISFTLSAIARALFAIFGGTLADRYGRRTLLVIPSFAMIPLYLVAAVTGDWLILLIMLIGTNVLSALTGPAFSAVIAESSSEGHVAHSFSLSEFSVIAALVAGPIAGAVLVGIVSIPVLIGINAVILIVTSALRWGIRETPHRVTGPAPKLRAALDANVRWFILLGTLVTLAFSLTFGPYFAILARDSWHNSESAINLLYAAGNAASMVGILLGRLADRWGARRVFVLGSLGYGISAIAWGLAPGWQWGLIPILIAFGFSEAEFIAYQTLQTGITTRETRTSVFGVITATTGVIGGLGPAIGAWLIASGGNPMPFVAAGALALVTIALVFPIQSKTAAVEHTPAGAQAE